ncbi:hypothetical protein P9112_008309 [Eukaryota sp. TZLM1-RC]
MVDSDPQRRPCFDVVTEMFSLFKLPLLKENQALQNQVVALRELSSNQAETIQVLEQKFTEIKTNFLEVDENNKQLTTNLKITTEELQQLRFEQSTNQATVADIASLQQELEESRLDVHNISNVLQQEKANHKAEVAKL